MGGGKKRFFSLTFNRGDKESLELFFCTDCTHSYPGCTFSLKSLTDRWSVTLTCPSPLSNPPFIIIQVFCELAIRLSCLKKQAEGLNGCRNPEYCSKLLLRLVDVMICKFNRKQRYRTALLSTNYPASRHSPRAFKP